MGERYCFASYLWLKFWMLALSGWNAPLFWKMNLSSSSDRRRESTLLGILKRAGYNAYLQWMLKLYPWKYICIFCWKTCNISGCCVWKFCIFLRCLIGKCNVYCLFILHFTHTFVLDWIDTCSVYNLSLQQWPCTLLHLFKFSLIICILTYSSRISAYLCFIKILALLFNCLLEVQ